MTTLLVPVLAIALIGQVIAATDNSSALNPPAAKPQIKPYRQSAPSATAKTPPKPSSSTTIPMDLHAPLWF